MTIEAAESGRLSRNRTAAGHNVNPTTLWPCMNPDTDRLGLQGRSAEHSVEGAAEQSSVGTAALG